VAFAAVNTNGSNPPALRRRTASVAACAALALVGLVLVGLDSSALCAVPALLLPALLALRRYPGERLLAAGLQEARRERRRPPQSSVAVASSPDVGMPRGRLLLAWSLAVRPPPRLRLAAG
jgi:hypothetical protein